MQYIISELVLELGFENDYLNRRMAGYAPSGVSLPCDFSVTMSTTGCITLPKGKVVTGGDCFYVLKKDDGDFAVFRYVRKTGVITALMEFSGSGAHITMIDLRDSSKNTVDAAVFALLGYAFNHFALLNSRMVLHGSSIITGGRSVIFSAPSETGKSTHTALWKKYYPDTVLLNDDTPVVGKKNGIFYAWGSPWSGKTEININKEAPLGAIVFLNRGEKNVIERISPASALPLLVEQARKIPVKDDMANAFDMCFELSKNVPIYKLYCDISKEAVETVRKELKIR